MYLLVGKRPKFSGRKRDSDDTLDRYNSNLSNGTDHKGSKTDFKSG